VFLFLVNVFLLVIGIPLETAPALTIVTPVLVPLAAIVGIDPVHFGVIVCFNLVLGLITPPVGGVLFSICGITGISLERLSRGIWIPFLIAVGVLMMITFVRGKLFFQFADAPRGLFADADQFGLPVYQIL
jgi:C4-dicarboxylate transporter DctM subunit